MLNNSAQIEPSHQNRATNYLNAAVSLSAQAVKLVNTLMAHILLYGLSPNFYIQQLSNDQQFWQQQVT